MDQKSRPSTSFSVYQSPSVAVTCQILTSQNITSTIVSPSTSNYVLTSSNLRPITNYTLVASTQASTTHQYVVQSNIRTTVPQYVSTGNVRHILSSSSQPSNVTYMLPSGAHIVRMNNVITTTNAGEQRPSTQYILTSSSQKLNPTTISQLGSQSLKTSIATISESTPGSSGAMSRNLGVTTSTPTIIQRSSLNLPRLNTAYISKKKPNEPPKIAFRPKLNDQKPGTSFILTSNDGSRNKSVPISSIQKLNKNFMQIPLIQKSNTVLSTNTLKSNAEPQKAQPIRSVILPSNYRTSQVSTQQGTDCKIVLNSINVPTQVLNSNDRPSTSNTPVSNIQQLNTNFMKIPIAQKPGTVLTHSNIQPNIDNNIRIGQHQTIRSVILPSNYRKAMISSPRKGVDYRLVLKPVNIQPQMLKMPQPRFASPRHTSVRNASPRQIAHSVRPILHPNRVPVTLPSTSRIQNEVIANSKIKPIPLRERKSQLVISEKSIQICVDELNSKRNIKEEPVFNLTEPAMKLVQAEVTYRLFYLLRECKKVLIRTRSNILTEESVRQVCSEYFATFYGNKLWPLFCLKLNKDENSVWMRKHNNVNLVGWIKHPKFRDPSYIKKRLEKNIIKNNLPLSELIKISEVVYEHSQPDKINNGSIESHQPTKIFYQSLKNDQISLKKILTKDNYNNNETDISTSVLDIPQANQLSLIRK